MGFCRPTWVRLAATSSALVVMAAVVGAVGASPAQPAHLRGRHQQPRVWVEGVAVDRLQEVIGCRRGLCGIALNVGIPESALPALQQLQARRSEGKA